MDTVAYLDLKGWWGLEYVAKCLARSLAQQLQERKVSSVGGAQAPLGPTVDTPLHGHVHS